MGTSSPPSALPEIGSSIGGCRIVRLIGRGGMGAVYEAQQVALERRVAIKVLRLDIGAGDESLREQFLKEARLAAMLNHPNIVQIFNVGRENDVDYIVMEYVEGVTFKELLAKQPKFPFARLARIAQKVARGLAAAHKERIVHRDIKPENIMVTAAGEIKITDFGAASLAVNVENPKENIIGTPLYLAPEVILRQPIDGRADIYALGLMLYAAAAGAHPIAAKSIKLILKAQLYEPLPPLKDLRPELPGRFVKLMETLCAKRPHERCTSEELLKVLESNPDWEKESGEGLLSEAPAGPGAAADLSKPAEEGKKSILHARLLITRDGEKAAAPAPPRSNEAAGARNQVKAGGAAPKTDPRLNELCVQARFQLMKRSLKKAEELFNQALSLDPQSETALLGLARLCTDAGRADEAIAHLRQVLQKGNCDPKVILDSSHFSALKDHKEFRALLAEFSL
ncbi:MAG: protein kinase [Planctomycetes bacterium]|nr:protein kinase [Planctomycetota bacterium]